MPICLKEEMGGDLLKQRGKGKKEGKKTQVRLNGKGYTYMHSDLMVA